MIFKTAVIITVVFYLKKMKMKIKANFFLSIFILLNISSNLLGQEINVEANSSPHDLLSNRKSLIFC